MPSEHPKHGNASYMVFLVEETLFHFPMRLLKQSQYFRDMIEESHTGLESEGKDNNNPISISGITAFDMASFLDVLEASYIYGDPNLDFNQWASALHLATMWAFDAIRDRIIVEMDKTISTQEPLNRIDASLKCRVEKWLHPAYEALCQRGEGLKAGEIERLGPTKSAAILRIREALPLERDPSIDCCCPSCRGRSVSCVGCGYQWNVPQTSIFRKNVDKVIQRFNILDPSSRATNAMGLIKDEPVFQYV
ncbi:hypothetical protein FRC01_001873 [Tulasnella sp. 417]|nr:hypothetical protein FRC01_001873 [Tulasnella sp. 417]